ncbi:MAG: acyl-CoA dehydrogenase, partial [Devosia sp.]
MLTLALVLVAIATFLALAMLRAPLWAWAVGAAIVGVLSRFIAPDGGFGLAPGAWGWLWALLPAIILGLLVVTPVRLAVFIGPAFAMVKSILPRVSRTEQEALDAGTVGWDAELFSGKPKWEKLFAIRKPTLSAEEQAFLAGPVETVCSMIDDWDTRHNRADLPPEVWAYLKQKGFLGM